MIIYLHISLINMHCMNELLSKGTLHINILCVNLIKYNNIFSTKSIKLQI